MRAATHNIAHLRLFKFDLQTAITAEGTFFTSFVSEFRTAADLSPLLHLHPLWSRLRRHLTQGIVFPWSPVSNTIRKLDLATSLQFGDHKGVQKFPAAYTDLNTSDILNGYSIPIPKSELVDIPGALSCPMNVIEQHTISETGEIVDKQ